MIFSGRLRNFRGGGGGGGGGLVEKFSGGLRNFRGMRIFFVEVL